MMDVLLVDEERKMRRYGAYMYFALGNTNTNRKCNWCLSGAERGEFSWLSFHQAPCCDYPLPPAGIFDGHSLSLFSVDSVVPSASCLLCLVRPLPTKFTGLKELACHLHQLPRVRTWTWRLEGGRLAPVFSEKVFTLASAILKGGMRHLLSVLMLERSHVNYMEGII